MLSVTDVKLAMITVPCALALAGCYMPAPGTHSISSGSSSHSYAAPETTTTTDAPPPSANMFHLTLTELSRDCFGDAGCNVEFQIVPDYLGSVSDIKSASFTLLYAVTGCDDAKSGNIEVRNGRFNPDKGYCSTSAGKLTATVTQILED